MDSVQIHKGSVERAIKAAQLRSQGLTYAAIGQQMGGIHKSTAQSAVRKGQRILAKRSAAKAKTPAKSDGWTCKSCGTHHAIGTLSCLNRKCRSYEPKSETASKHTPEEDFQHFLSYSGLGASYQRLNRSVIDLRVAYYTGAGIDVTAEGCSTCGGTGEVDETLGGIHTSDPHAPCPDCSPKPKCNHSLNQGNTLRRIENMIDCTVCGKSWQEIAAERSQAKTGAKHE
jgi:hypothetical protein